MKAQQVFIRGKGRPEVLHVEDVELPRPRRGEVRVAVVAAGVVRAPTRTSRHRPRPRIKAKGPVSTLVAEQRR